MTKSSPSPVSAWLQLIRVPNLFTVPGDVLVGLLLAASTLTHDTWLLVKLVEPVGLP